jgi:hypothetical protein
MEELMMMVPTYYGAAQVNPESFPDKEEFDEPRVPVLVRDADGVRVVLGSHDYNDAEKPDIQIERRPNGWAIFLHPVGGGDPSGLVYFLDDGRSFLVPDGLVSEQIEVLESVEQVPMIDDPPPTQAAQNRFASCPKLSAALVQAQKALRGDSNDAEHDALLALIEALESVEVGLHESAPSADSTPHVVVVGHAENAE